MTIVRQEHWYKLALFVATMAHKGQFRHDGRTPYIKHPLEVSFRVPKRLKPIALLHDVCEDNDVKFQDLEYLDFPKYIIDAVFDLTKGADEDYFEDYLKKIKTNPDALIVKLEDIRHNMNDTPTEKQRAKYIKALAFLKG